MMDFFVRETRAVVEGDIAIVRMGSCGSLDPSFGCGTLGVPLTAMSVTTNYARGGDPYLFSTPVRHNTSSRRYLLGRLLLLLDCCRFSITWHCTSISSSSSVPLEGTKE